MRTAIKAIVTAIGVLVTLAVMLFCLLFLIGAMRANAAEIADPLECIQGEIEWHEHASGKSPQLIRGTDYLEDLNYSIEGQYFWLQREGTSEDSIVSVRVPEDAATVTICVDESVTFESAPAPSTDEGDIGTSLTTYKPFEIWADFLPRLIEFLTNPFGG